MTIQLPEHRQQFVHDLVQSGRYTSEDEVIAEALQLLEERDEQARLVELRREIAVGIDQADRGELAPFDPHASLARIRSRQATGDGQSTTASVTLSSANVLPPPSPKR
jgi:antitoxin ParD1/3/4